MVALLVLVFMKQQQQLHLLSLFLLELSALVHFSKGVNFHLCCRWPCTAPTRRAARVLGVLLAA